VPDAFHDLHARRNGYARPHDAVLGDAAELDGWVDVDAYPQAVIEPGLLVYRFDAPLFFTNAGRYCDRVVLALRNQPGTERWVVRTSATLSSPVT